MTKFSITSLWFADLVFWPPGWMTVFTARCLRNQCVSFFRGGCTSRNCLFLKGWWFSLPQPWPPPWILPDCPSIFPGSTISSHCWKGRWSWTEAKFWLSPAICPAAALLPLKFDTIRHAGPEFARCRVPLPLSSYSFFPNGLLPTLSTWNIR